MNLKLSIIINSYAGQYEWLDALASFFAQEASLLLVVLLLILWVMDKGKERKKNQYAIIIALWAVVIGRGIITPTIRYFFPQARPFLEHNFNLLIDASHLGATFPSGHTMVAFTLALPVLIYNKKAGFWLILLAILISISRVFVGVHYLSDIIFTFLIAGLIVLIVNYNRQYLVAPIVNWLRRNKKTS